MTLRVKKEFGNTRSRKPDLQSLVYGKIPPQAPEMEAAVLGAIILEKDKQHEVFSIIPHEECFYVDANQKIYEAIKHLYNEGLDIDLLTISSELRRNDNLELVGGMQYLIELSSNLINSAHVETHAYKVMETYFMRELIRISGQAIGSAYEDSTDPFELLETTEREISEITSENIGGESKHIRTIIKTTIEEKELQRASTDDCSGVPTGYDLLNSLTSGWQKTDLIILAARPAVGKTSFILNLSFNAAIHNFPVAIFSLEMSAGQLNDRLAARALNIPHDNIKHPKRMTEKVFQEYVNGMNNLAKLPIFVEDAANISSLQLRAKAAKLKRKHNIQLIIVDYLQLMRGNVNRNANREQEISQISRELKHIAKDLEVPVIALSQLNRAIESRSDNIPRLSDLRESGAIEQDADQVMFLYAAPMANDKKGFDDELSKDIMLLIAKNRHGNTGDILFNLNKSIQKFTETDKSFTPIDSNDIKVMHNNNQNINNFDENPF